MSTDNARQAKRRAAAILRGHTRREFYATPEEHAMLRAALAELRRAHRDDMAVDVDFTSTETEATKP